MKPNKALQSIQPTQTSTNTEQAVKVANEASTGAEKVDNPFYTLTTMQLYMNFVRLRKELTSKYGIQQSGVDVLVRLGYEWSKNHQPMTVYRLVDGQTCNITGMCFMMKRLLDKGLVEIVGHGKWGSNAYGPSNKLLREFEKLSLVA